MFGRLMHMFLNPTRVLLFLQPLPHLSCYFLSSTWWESILCFYPYPLFFSLSLCFWIFFFMLLDLVMTSSIIVSFSACSMGTFALKKVVTIMIFFCLITLFEYISNSLSHFSFYFDSGKSYLSFTITRGVTTCLAFSVSWYTCFHSSSVAITIVLFSFVGSW